MGGDEKMCGGLILLRKRRGASPFFGRWLRMRGFAPHPTLSPQAGRGGASGGRRGLLLACGEKVPALRQAQGADEGLT